MRVWVDKNFFLVNNSADENECLEKDENQMKMNTLEERKNSL